MTIENTNIKKELADTQCKAREDQDKLSSENQKLNSETESSNKLLVIIQKINKVVAHLLFE